MFVEASTYPDVVSTHFRQGEGGPLTVQGYPKAKIFGIDNGFLQGQPTGEGYLEIKLEKAVYQCIKIPLYG